MPCGNGTKVRTRECIEECKDKSIEIQRKPCYMGCCPGMYVGNNYVLCKIYVADRHMLEAYIAIHTCYVIIL